MRTSLRVAIILTIFSGHALAAKGKKNAAPTHSAETMNSNDPAEKEQSEKKEAAPKPETVEEQEQKQARLDSEQVKKTRARDKIAVFGNVLIGFGKAPEAGAGAQKSTGKTTAATFMIGGHYDLSPQLTLGLRIPWTIGSARQEDGLNASVQALGAPELLGEYRIALSPFTRLPVLFGLGIPLAQGNYETAQGFRQTYLNDFADAASGYRDPELFQPKRLPIILGLGIDYERRALNVHAATKFVFGLNLGATYQNPNDPAGTLELKSLTFRNVTSAGIGYQFLAKPVLFGALDTWVAYSAINTVEFNSKQNATPPARIQVVFEPRVGARFGKISPSLGYIFPIGGRLADNSTSGLELHCDVAF